MNIEVAKGKVEVFQSDTDALWYWHIKARNGKIVAQSEGYKAKAGAQRGVRALGRALGIRIML